MSDRFWKGITVSIALLIFCLTSAIPAAGERTLAAVAARPLSTV